MGIMDDSHDGNGDAQVLPLGSYSFYVACDEVKLEKKSEPYALGVIDTDGVLTITAENTVTLNKGSSIDALRTNKKDNTVVEATTKDGTGAEDSFAAINVGDDAKTFLISGTPHAFATSVDYTFPESKADEVYQ